LKKLSLPPQFFCTMGNQPGGADSPIPETQQASSPPASNSNAAPPVDPAANAPAQLTIDPPAPAAQPANPTPPKSEIENKTDDRDDSPKPDLKNYSLVLKAKSERKSVAFNELKKEYLGVADISAPLFNNEKRAPLDIVCVLDTSGSMAGGRCSLLRKTIRRLVRGVQAKDRVAIVEFNSRVRVLLPFTAMNAEAKESCKAVIKNIRASGGTFLSGGLLEGLKMVKNRAPAEANEICSLLLFTDGEANQGIRGVEQLVKAAENAMGLSSTGNFNKPTTADPTKWTTDEVAQWLVSVGLDLEDLLKKIKSEKIDGSILMHDLTEEMMEEELGVGRIHRAKFMRELDKLREGEDDQAEPETNNALKCTINTFGYGSSHNTELLEKLAEKFDGLYYYVKDAEGIKEGFASCLGGLMSTVATNLQLTVTPLNGSKNVKILSDFKNETKKKSTVAKIGDIQSEESRHIVFSFDLPKEKAERQNVTYVSVKLTYENAVNGTTGVAVSQLNVDRGKVTCQRQEEVDVQYNRILTAKVLDEAEKLGKQGKMEEARNALRAASEVVMKSPSTRHNVSQGLVKDMNRCIDGYKSQKTYQGWGRNYSKQNKVSLRMERSCNFQAEQYSTQSIYQNVSKIATFDKFQGECSDDSDDGSLARRSPPRSAPPRSLNRRQQAMPNRRLDQYATIDNLIQSNSLNRSNIAAVPEMKETEAVQPAKKKKKRFSLRRNKKKKKSKKSDLSIPTAALPVQMQQQAPLDSPPLRMGAPQNSLPPLDFSNGLMATNSVDDTTTQSLNIGGAQLSQYASLPVIQQAVSEKKDEPATK